MREAARARETRREDHSSDTEADADAWPAGSGLKGIGPPLWVGKGARVRQLIDGGGLCSTGLWPPWSRPRVMDTALTAIRAAMKREIVRLPQLLGRTCEQLFDDAACGRLTESPFPLQVVDSLREYMHDQLSGSDVAGPSRPRDGDMDQPIDVRLLQAVLIRAGDPDPGAVDRLAVGVPLGVDTRLPRTPAVYPRKQRWSLPQQNDPWTWDRPWSSGTWRENYKSTWGHEDEMQAQLDDHVANGLAERLTETEVKRRWPDASIASLGALHKLDSQGGSSLRLLFDGTTGVDLNTRIRVRDQEQMPGAPDIKRYQREQARAAAATIGLTIDVKDAHRTVRIRRADWRHQLCRARVGGDVTMYRSGVFGISSISYWWSRLASGIQRALLYMTDSDMAIWVLRVADDFKVESTSHAPQHALLFVLLFLQLLRVPLQWRKLKGGLEVDWVGFHVKMATHELGLSAARAAWVVDWCRRLIRDGAARIDEMREGLGRLAFVAGALEYERPFLAPLYSFVGLQTGNPLKPLPLYILIALHFIADRISLRRHYPSAVTRTAVPNGPRVDARAEGQSIGIGGWLPRRGPSGELSTAHSPWFMIELDQRAAPWAFLREGEPYRTIASLEAYATLIGAKVLLGDLPRDANTLLTLPSFTDNRGNASALTRLSSTKFPLCCISMELAVLMESRGMQLQLEWVPRSCNEEADRLSNGISVGFDPALRVQVDPLDMKWAVLDSLLASGAEFDRLKRTTSLHIISRRRRAVKPKDQRLRAREPW